MSGERFALYRLHTHVFVGYRHSGHGMSDHSVRCRSFRCSRTVAVDVAVDCCRGGGDEKENENKAETKMSVSNRACVMRASTTNPMMFVYMFVYTGRLGVMMYPTLLQGRRVILLLVVA